MSATRRTTRAELGELAKLHGVLRSYRAVDGSTVRASESALVGVLGALGVACTSAAEITDSLAATRAELDARLLEPVLVTNARARVTTRLDLLSETEARRATLEVTLDTGDTLAGRLRDLGAAAPRARARGLEIDLATLAVPVGDHALRIETPRRALEARLLVCPVRPALPRRCFGVYAPLWGLRSSSDWGIGSTSELERLGRFIAASGATYLATSPLYAASYLEPAEVSPYRPFSRLAWNEIYLDPACLPEREADPSALVEAGSGTSGRALELARRSEQVDYVMTARLKRPVLERLAAVVDRGPRAEPFRDYLATRRDVVAYARFRADHENGSAQERLRARRYHEYAQFAMDEALAHFGRGGPLASLYLDLPVGVDPNGFDPAYHEDAFATGASIGAPPDDFYPKGQDWSMPALHPERTRTSGHRYWTAVVEHALRHASVLRVDHVAGLERCYLVPAGHTPSDGAYVNYPSVELRAVLSIAAHRHGAVLVGEDLGTVPIETRRAMHRDAMLRSFVYQLEANGSAPAPKAPSDVVASFGTHDLPRFSSFVAGADLAERGATQRSRRQRATLRSALEARGAAERGVARAYRGFLSWLSESAAAIALVDLGDLVGDAVQENRPGPLSGSTSWRHRMASTLDELEGSAWVRRRLSVVAAGRERGSPR